MGINILGCRGHIFTESTIRFLNEIGFPCEVKNFEQRGVRRYIFPVRTQLGRPFFLEFDLVLDDELFHKSGDSVDPRFLIEEPTLLNQDLASHLKVTQFNDYLNYKFENSAHLIEGFFVNLIPQSSSQWFGTEVRSGHFSLDSGAWVKNFYSKDVTSVFESLLVRRKGSGLLGVVIKLNQDTVDHHFLKEIQFDGETYYQFKESYFNFDLFFCL